MPSIVCTLAGAVFRPAEAKEQIKRLAIGDELELRPDSDNEYDAFAVRVYSDEHFIGFIPKSDNPAVFKALTEGEDVACAVVGFESTLKPVLEIDFQ